MLDIPSSGQSATVTSGTVVVPHNSVEGAKEFRLSEFSDAVTEPV